MSSQLIAVIIDNLISIVGGVIATLVGFRVAGPKPGASQKFDAWYDKLGKHLKWIGPFLILLSLVQIGIHVYGYQ